MYSSIVLGLTQQLRVGTVLDYAHMKDLVGSNGLKKAYEPFAYLYFNYFFQNEDSPSFVRKGLRINFLSKFLFYEGEALIRQLIFLLSFEIILAAHETLLIEFLLMLVCTTLCSHVLL